MESLDVALARSIGFELKVCVATGYGKQPGSTGVRLTDKDYSTRELSSEPVTWRVYTQGIMG